MTEIARCPTCKRRLRRSTEANRRYWALLHAISEHIKPNGAQYGIEAWHAYAKSRWLGCDEVKMPNGSTMTIPRSTADLDVAEFSDYMTQVEAWANGRGVFLEDIEEAACS